MFESIQNYFLRKKNHITYNDKKRQQGFALKTSLCDRYVSELNSEEGVSEYTKYLCDCLANEYFEMALWVIGEFELDQKSAVVVNEKGENVELSYEVYDEKCASVSVKSLLEMGLDTRVLFYPVYKNDDFEEYVRYVYRQGFRKGLTVMPYFYDKEDRPEDVKLINYVFLDMKYDRYQFKSLGEIALLESYDTTEDVIAMLCRADTDFSHVENEGDKGVHAFTYLMKDSVAADESYKEKVIDIFEKVYMNDENGLNEKQRDKIMNAMLDCFVESSEISKEICQERKIRISKSLNKMINKFKSKNNNEEKVMEK